ncbi:methionine aminopeptidase [Salibacterium salarium]|uniref:Methionine aminopeptidase n=1 Tax=Salibacterium salarium TaxID=284579 RepID=A0A3R9QQ36_9BACI|nr:methionine aminopeptidase [Salibacterium salarium]RSL30873.1 methionine aminopeptidase [Salibacterium salarium]
MNLWQWWSDWRTSARNNKIEAMQQQGKCPDCRGRGIQLVPNEYYYTDPLSCPGCEGSGLFSDWENAYH